MANNGHNFGDGHYYGERDWDEGPGRRRRRARRGRPVLSVVVGIALLGAGFAGAREVLLLRASTQDSGGGPGLTTVTPPPGATAGDSPKTLSTGLTATALDPSKFAQGACMAFTQGGVPSRHKTVFVDAGHGGIDPGGTGHDEGGSPVSESQVNLAVAMDAMKDLTADGYRVVVSRTQQTTVLKLGPADTNGNLLSVQGVRDDIAARDDCANTGHADLLVGVFMDAADSSMGGSLATYDAVRPFASDSHRFADLLQSDVLGKLNAAGEDIPDLGVHTDAGMGSTSSAAGLAYGHLELLGPAYPQDGFTDPSDMPGALIEPLFLTDPFEGSLAESSRGQTLMADGITQAVQEYFSQAGAA